MPDKKAVSFGGDSIRHFPWLDFADEMAKSPVDESPEAALIRERMELRGNPVPTTEEITDTFASPSTDIDQRFEKLMRSYGLQPTIYGLTSTQETGPWPELGATDETTP